MVLPCICFSYEEYYQSSNGNILYLNNNLPESFPKIDRIENLGKLFEEYEKENGLPQVYLSIRMDGNKIIFNLQTQDFRFFKDFYKGGTIYLLTCYYYLKNINLWFFDKIHELNPGWKNLRSDLADLKYLYYFTLYDDYDNSIQIYGEVGSSYSSFYGRTVSDMILWEPIFIKYNEKTRNVQSEITFSDKYFYRFSLGSPYNSITKSYYPSYFVYLFFKDYLAIKNIPPYYGGNLLNEILTGKWKCTPTDESKSDNIFFAEYYGNNNIILVSPDASADKISIYFELIDDRVFKIMVNTGPDEFDQHKLEFLKQTSILGNNDSLVDGKLAGDWNTIGDVDFSRATFNGHNNIIIFGESDDQFAVIEWKMTDNDNLSISIHDSENNIVGELLFKRVIDIQ
jgi:hypothetical protein